MEATKKIYGIALALTCSIAGTLKAQNIYVANYGTNTIGEYTTSGATVNASLISGLNGPEGIAISGTNLFVANNGNNTIGEYTTSGATVNASLITGSSGLNGPEDIAISGTNLFVVNEYNQEIGEYTISGATVNASLISGLANPQFIAISGTNLFVVNVIQEESGEFYGYVDEYSTSGLANKVPLISLGSGFDYFASGIAISGTNLFVVSDSTIGEYTTSGATVNASLISSGLNVAYGIAISPGASSGAPVLQVVHSGNTAVISWPTVSGWSLQQSSNIGTADWVSSGFPVTSSNGINYVNITSPTGDLFFRLQGP